MPNHSEDAGASPASSARSAPLPQAAPTNASATGPANCRRHATLPLGTNGKHLDKAPALVPAERRQSLSDSPAMYAQQVEIAPAERRRFAGNLPTRTVITEDGNSIEVGSSSKESLREGWLDFLSPYVLQWFCTLTFRESVHPERAMKLFRMWTNEINRSLYGKRWKERGQGVYWILALEYQRRGVIHFHALIGDVENLNHRTRRLHWMDRWHQLAGIARVEEIESDEAVHRYVTKYVLKDGEIDLSESLKSFAQQKSLSNP